MTNKQTCCGCTACVHICPVHCISMEEDGEGFLYPVIAEDDCIHCHQCEAVCPQHLQIRELLKEVDRAFRN